jgi:hypothetical protein
VWNPVVTETDIDDKFLVEPASEEVFYMDTVSFEEIVKVYGAAFPDGAPISAKNS